MAIVRIDPTHKRSALVELLSKHRTEFLPVLPFDFTKSSNLCRLDFSAGNREMETLDFSSSAALGSYIFGKLKSCGAAFGYGGYGEDRAWYRRSPHFTANGEVRSIHLGVDLWCAAGTKVSAPLSGFVHSFKDNANFGDYGPTVILAHELEGLEFYSLYGHLSRRSLASLQTGNPLNAGEYFAELGTEGENGDWPPHLHLQLIADIGDFRGDYPGVAAPGEATGYLENCPDPNLILGIAG